MKKTIAIILLLASIFAFSACNSFKPILFVCMSNKAADKAFTLNESPFTSEQIEKINTVLDTGKILIWRLTKPEVCLIPILT